MPLSPLLCNAHYAHSNSHIIADDTILTYLSLAIFGRAGAARKLQLATVQFCTLLRESNKRGGRHAIVMTVLLLNWRSRARGVTLTSSVKLSAPRERLCATCQWRPLALTPIALDDEENSIMLVWMVGFGGKQSAVIVVVVLRHAHICA